MLTTLSGWEWSRPQAQTPAASSRARHAPRGLMRLIIAVIIIPAQGVVAGVTRQPTAAAGERRAAVRARGRGSPAALAGPRSFLVARRAAIAGSSANSVRQKTTHPMRAASPCPKYDPPPSL